MKKLGKGEMTVSEMGKLGGLARAAKCTGEQLSAIGRYGYEHGLAKYSTAERRKMLRRALAGMVEPLTRQRQHCVGARQCAGGRSQFAAPRFLTALP